MKFYFSWTKVLKTTYLMAIVSAGLALCAGSWAASEQKLSKETSSKTVPSKPKPARKLTADQIKTALKKVARERIVCQKSKCKIQSLLSDFETVLISFLSEKERADFLSAENLSLKNQIQITQFSIPYREAARCTKDQMLKDLMLNQGILDVGNRIYARRPLKTTGATCWSNGKKKKEATVTLCEFPFAINVQTRGGTAKSPVLRQREYMFSSNGCDLEAVRISDQSIKEGKEIKMSSATCVQQWNKRTADSVMTKDQVRAMEDTIALCFREHLLPRPESVGVRVPARVPSGF